MKKLYSSILIACLLLSAIPMVMAISTGSGTNPNVNTEQFAPKVWMCDSRVVLDDNTEPGRLCNPNNPNSPDNGSCVWNENVSSYQLNGTILYERINNYAFEGEKVVWDVLVMDKNGINKVQDVFALIGNPQGALGTGDIITTTTVPIYGNVTHSVSYCGQIPFQSTSWTKNITLPKFNSSLGTLTNAALTFGSNVVSNLYLEHLSTDNPGNYIIDIYANVTMNSGDINLLNQLVFEKTANLSVYDGVTDYNGTSGVTYLNISGTDSSTQAISNLSKYTASSPGETFDVNVISITLNTKTGPANTALVVLTSASAQSCINYTYTNVEVVGSYNVTNVTHTNSIEANCILDHIVNDTETIKPECNARIGEENLTHIPDNTAAYYKCILTVETPESMYGKYWVTVEAIDLDGKTGTMAENEYWFFNPVVELSVDGSMTFNDVRPGTDSYSSTMLVGNDADKGSGVLMDMFISGTDFYDSASSGAKCPYTNQLSLSAFRYFATNGAYNSAQDLNVDTAGSIVRNTDAEGYTNIDYGIGFNNPYKFYDNMEILQSPLKLGPYYAGNVLAPGAEMALTFKLSLPEPCNGNFDTGSIYFWGEAI